MYYTRVNPRISILGVKWNRVQCICYAAGTEQPFRAPSGTGTAASSAQWLRGSCFESPSGSERTCAGFSSALASTKLVERREAPDPELHTLNRYYKS